MATLSPLLAFCLALCGGLIVALLLRGGGAEEVYQARVKQQTPESDDGAAQLRQGIDQLRVALKEQQDEHRKHMEALKEQQEQARKLAAPKEDDPHKLAVSSPSDREVAQLKEELARVQQTAKAQEAQSRQEVSRLQDALKKRDSDAQLKRTAEATGAMAGLRASLNEAALKQALEDDDFIHDAKNPFLGWTMRMRVQVLVLFLLVCCFGEIFEGGGFACAGPGLSKIIDVVFACLLHF